MGTKQTTTTTSKKGAGKKIKNESKRYLPRTKNIERSIPKNQPCKC